jgi:LPS export ABC transporter protein LptC
MSRLSLPVGRPLLVTLLAALALALGVALFWQQRQVTERRAAPSEPEMDAEIWGVQLRQRDGDQRWRLRAERAAHFPGAGVTRIRPVRLEVLRAEGPPLTADARRGRIADGSNEVTLEEDVVVVDPAGYRLTTDTLHYLPQAARADTDDPVHVSADFGEADAVGATVWTGQRRIELHRNVTTTLTRRPGDAS